MSLARINYWAEGPTDCAAARRIIAAAGGEPGEDYSGRRRATTGKDYLDVNLPRFNAAARHAPWLVLRDSDGACAVELAGRLLPDPAPQMCLRIVIPSIEAWLMADRDEFANFLSVRVAAVPEEPDNVIDAKRKVVTLAARSSRLAVKSALCPHPGSGRREGPEYATYMIEFIQRSWQTERARLNSRSLNSALERLSELIAQE